MKRVSNGRSVRRQAVLVTQGLAGGVGLVYGFEFGHRLSGPLLGVALAANSALFCSLMVGAIESALKWRKGSAAPEP